MPSSRRIDPAGGDAPAKAASFVIVNWNTRELTAQAVASILRFEGEGSCEVIVVDNGSTDGSADHLRGLFPGITVLAQGENLGFARANNLGAEAARGEWLVLFNSDAYLVEPVLPELLRSASAAGDCLLACRLTYPDGSAQVSGGPFPSLAGYLLEALGTTRAYLRRALEAQDPGPSGWRRLDWLTGAFIMVRRKDYLDLGGLEPAIFMYGEDLDFCRKAAARGMSCYMDGRVSAVHIGGGSIGHHSARTLIHTDRGRLAYFRKWHGPAAALGLRLAFILRSAARAAAFGLAGLPPSGGSMRERAAVHVRGLIHLLGGGHGRNPV